MNEGVKTPTEFENAGTESLLKLEPKLAAASQIHLNVISNENDELNQSFGP